MRDIHVPRDKIYIPVLGFGCSSLTSVGRKQALRLLEGAFDAGIRHFDVARYYGYGEAEGILGTFLKSRRSQVTVTTKFGIEPPRPTSTLRVALGIGRRFLRLVPSARKVVQQHTSAFVNVKGNAFSAADAQRNLETSLRELGTDYIDFYLLHDYVSNESSSEEVVAFLQKCVRMGKIRTFGLGTRIDSVMCALEHEPDLCAVIQFQNSVLTRNRGKLPSEIANRLVITHGALGDGYRLLWSFLQENPKTANAWSGRLGLDCSEKKTLAALMLNYAVEANSGGMVLFSSRNAERLRYDAESVRAPKVKPWQIKAFAELVELTPCRC
jgi:aryl-alcohol dehydrogenase-like predicted oxidoreductase